MGNTSGPNNPSNGHSRDVRQRMTELLDQARRLSKEGNWNELNKCCSQIIKLDARCLDAWISKGVAFSKLKRSADAIASFERAIDIDPRSANAWFDKGVVLLATRHPNEAEACFREAAKLNHPRAAEALKRCRKATGGNQSLHPPVRTSAEDWFARGDAAEQAGRYEDARSFYDEALEADPHNVDAWLNKGRLLRQLGETEQAVACYDRVTQIAPQRVEAWVNKSVALRDLGKLDEAMACVDNALQVDPNDAKALTNKAMLLSNDPLWSAAALELYDRALLSDPNDVVAWLNRGALLTRSLEQHAAANECFDHALRLDPALVEAWCNKAIALAQLGQPKEALVCLEKEVWTSRCERSRSQCDSLSTTCWPNSESHRCTTLRARPRSNRKQKLLRRRMESMRETAQKFSS